jgi:xanthine dehydrogenase YagT iron-sulfur-binding subunit
VLLEVLAREPVPKAEVEARIRAAMNGHICRCTGYIRYYEAIRAVILADPRLTR